MLEKLKVTILYDAIEDTEKATALAKGQELTLVYEDLSEALTECGHKVITLAADPNIKHLAAQLERDKSDLIFNICESIAGVGQHEQSVAALLELSGKAFTGAGSLGLSLAQDKVLSKKLFHFHGIPYPKFSTVDSGQVQWSDDLKFPLFVKPANQDASIGIDYKAVVHNVKDLMERISFIHQEIGAPALIEEYIEGREIYIGVFGNDKPKALPLLEWDFSKLGSDVPKIASAEHKWDEDSAGYKSPFIFPGDMPPELYEKMQVAATDAFKALKLRDYGRIDMRLRKTGEQWEFFVIEANPNPCIEQDSEFMKAADKFGMKYNAVVEDILEMAIARARIQARANQLSAAARNLI